MNENENENNYEEQDFAIFNLSKCMEFNNVL